MQFEASRRGWSSISPFSRLALAASCVHWRPNVRCGASPESGTEALDRASGEQYPDGLEIQVGLVQPEGLVPAHGERLPRPPPPPTRAANAAHIGRKLSLRDGRRVVQYNLRARSQRLRGALIAAGPRAGTSTRMDQAMPGVRSMSPFFSRLITI